MSKIAIVANNSWYAWNMRANLGFAFKKKGYEVIFISPSDLYSESIKKHFKHIDITLSPRGINPIEDLKTIFRFYRIYQQLQPDIILQFTIKPNIYGSISASILKIPFVNNITGLGTLFMNQSLITMLAKLLYKLSQKRAAKIFFQNKDDLKMFLDQRLVSENKCKLLPGSGVDVERFYAEKKENDGVFRFLLISRMLWSKGIKEFVEAARIIKQKYKYVEFQLLGHLDMKTPTAISKKQMDIWIKDGDIIYLGTSEDVRVEIAQSDCIVLPSYYREGTPRSLLEGASMQRPIITTDNYGCRDVVDDGVNGYICNTRNSSDLAEKMEKMLNLTEDQRHIMGKNGREKMIREFDEKIVINNYLETIKAILR